MAAPPFADRVALVTGGSRGIGLAITDRLIAAGAQVAVASRSQPDSLPPGARWFGADVREAGQVEELVTDVVDHYGRLDVAVNNAGGSPVAEAATASPRFSSAIVTLNLLAPLYVATAANRVMQGQDAGGVIVSIASLRAHQPSPGTAAYAAAKAGLVNLTRSLAVEWAPRVRVNCVSPATLDQGSSPLGRGATADDVAGAVLHLASPASAYVTGADLVVHGGGERPAFLAAVAGH
jgi:NAD(P)-dependent dehydrogenase (short-subunit alcohol dehydrogenase family)